MVRYCVAFALAALVCACGRPVERVLPESAVVKGVNFVGITVTDLDAATAFYQSGTDLEIVDTQTLSANPTLRVLTDGMHGNAQTRMLRTVNAQVQLMAFQSPHPDWSAVPVQGPGIMHVCYQVDQETQAYQRFLTAGADVIGDEALIRLSRFNPVYYGYFQDLDGAIIEIEHVDIDALNLDTPPSNQYRMRHVALTTPDADQLAEFYKVFLEQPDPRRLGGTKGFSSERVDGVTGLENSAVRMAWFQVRNMELEITQLASHPTQLPNTPRPINAIGYNMIVFDVDDLEAGRARLLEAGGTIEHETDSFLGAPTIFGRDTDGNLIGVQASDVNSVVSSRNFDGNGL